MGIYLRFFREILLAPRADKYKNLPAQTQDLPAPGKRAMLNVEPCSIGQAKKYMGNIGNIGPRAGLSLLYLVVQPVRASTAAERATCADTS